MENQGQTKKCIHCGRELPLSSFNKCLKNADGLQSYCVDHAINRVGDKYVDVTWELCLKLDVSSQPYAALIEASRDEVLADIEAHNNTTGNYYLHNYLKTHEK